MNIYKLILLMLLLNITNQKKEKLHSIKDVVDFIKSCHTPSFNFRKITVFGWDKTWEYDLLPSVQQILYEPLTINENIAPSTNDNRPGDIHHKEYITVHDTGDVKYSAKDWSDIVYTQILDGHKYSASFQYVVGNDGIYRNIPDKEGAFHAGDGYEMESEFTEIPTGVEANGENPKVTISSDGFYELNGIKSLVQVPYNTDAGRYCTTEDINDLGIFTSIHGNMYYIGNTWYSPSFKKLANRGGNRNSVGIETCIVVNDDIFLNWQRLAKLVAKLMDDFNLSIDRVKQHHYFSGKDCPMTTRHAGLWEMFKDLVKKEYKMRMFMKEGFNFSLTGDSEYVDSRGRILKRGVKGTKVAYKVTVSHVDGQQESVMLETEMK